jgi:predicted dithiol-disulfide oxidoreductase (DUF899 family)
MQTPPIASREEWEAAFKQMLVKEKAMTRARDALAAERRRMPWLAVEKDDAFRGCSQIASQVAHLRHDYPATVAFKETLYLESSRRCY